MYLKLQILVPLITLISFNPVHSFKKRHKLLQQYEREKVYENKLLEELNNNLCEKAKTDLVIRLKICQRIFKLLRDDPHYRNPFKYSLYMNYEAFTSSSDSLYPVCDTKYIEIDKNTFGAHKSMICYSRPAILPDNNPNFHKISIFLGTFESVIVLRCSDSFFCEIHEWYEKNEGSRESSFFENPDNLYMVFNIPIPQTADTEELSSIFKGSNENILRMSRNGSHFMNDKDMPATLFDTICKVMFGSPEYREKCHSRSMLAVMQTKPRSYKQHLTVYDPFVKTKQLHEIDLDKLKSKIFNVSLYPCKNHKIKGNSDRTFKIMAGPNESSVILIEPEKCNDVPCIVPVLLIKNVTLTYFHYIERYF